MGSQKRPAKPPVGERRVGLARAISKLGYCSRSQAMDHIRSGRVTLNGSVTRNPEALVHFGRDHIVVDGSPLASEHKVHWMMNKPRGAVTTAADEKGRQTVYDLLPKSSGTGPLPWMAPVGRLDRASEGLLLFTNDSQWAALITAPESHLDKTYHVQISAVAGDVLLRKLEAGVSVEGGGMMRAKRAALLRAGEKNSWLAIVLDEGKNRQIRRMLESQDLEVLRLVRVAIGPLELGDLPKGAARRLTAQEKAALDQAISDAAARR